jgi:hypothetical protein
LSKVPSPSSDSLPGEGEYSGAKRADYLLHWILTLGAAGCAWQLAGLWAAAGVLIGLILLISSTNMILLAQFGSLRVVRLNRWIWVILTYLGLAAWVATRGAA